MTIITTIVERYLQARFAPDTRPSGDLSGVITKIKNNTNRTATDGQRRARKRITATGRWPVRSALDEPGKRGPLYDNITHLYGIIITHAGPSVITILLLFLWDDCVAPGEIIKPKRPDPECRIYTMHTRFVIKIKQSCACSYLCAGITAMKST